ncbi:MAG: thiolase family protein [Aureliella sp.]
MASSYIIAGCRTPIGKFLGGLSSLRSVELGGHAIAAAVERAGLAHDAIDQVIMGQVIQAGVGQAPARQASTLAGLPPTVGAATVNKVCGSGLFAAMLADMAIRAGEYQRVVAGGMESMSQAPHLLKNGRTGWKYGDQPMLDSIDVDGLRCAKVGLAMGCIAEWVAKEGTISRTAQDEWAVRSHQRASAAAEAFSAEIVPITVTEAKQQRTVANDEGPRPDSTLETLGKLKPVFASSLLGNDQATYQTTVTAGNASMLSDGGAAVVVVDEAVQRSSPTPWAFRIVGHCHYAAEHQGLFTAPVGAVRKLLDKTKSTVADIDLLEINEAFAAQMLACIDELGLDAERVNVRGGSIALGHPLGCSGARVLVTLIHNLLAQNLSRGIAALCLGGGESVAMLIERQR